MRKIVAQPDWISFAVILAFVAHGLSAFGAEAGGSPAVWTLTSLERALRSTPPGPEKKAVVRTARNEWESFQIAVRSDAPARIQDVVAGIFRGPGGATLPADCVTLYREHQLHFTVPTSLGRDFASLTKDFRPDWYPDPLIPFRHPMTGARLTGARFQAVPFELPANETHAFWVDLHVPREARPGPYKGELRIQFEGAKPAAVPVELEVWDFALPERAAMYTEFGLPAERMGRYYGNLVKKGTLSKAPDMGPIEEECARVTSDHRLNSPPPQHLISPKTREDGSFELAPEQLELLRSWAAKFQVNAIPIPRPQGRFKDPDADREKLNRWLKSWDRAMDAAGLGDRLEYTYLLDEPNTPTAYQEVRKWGKAIRASGSRVKVLVTEQTKTQDPAWGDLYGAVDIWVPLFPLFDPETAGARRKLGEQIWAYTALCQGAKPTPWWQTDFPILNYRVPAWIGWRYEMKGLLYWAGLTHWSHVEDTWTDPMTYQPGDRSRPLGKRAIFNGEGLLAYPARDAGCDGIVPSMRLKVLRDGLEDFDYLALLEARGLRDKALEIVMPVGGSWYEWAKEPAAYFAAREKLAAMIVKEKAKGDK